MLYLCIQLFLRYGLQFEKKKQKQNPHLFWKNAGWVTNILEMRSKSTMPHVFRRTTPRLSYDTYISGEINILVLGDQVSSSQLEQYFVQMKMSGKTLKKITHKWNCQLSLEEGVYFVVLSSKGFFLFFGYYCPCLWLSFKQKLFQNIVRYFF